MNVVIGFLTKYGPIVLSALARGSCTLATKAFAALPFLLLALGSLLTKDYTAAIHNLGLALGLGVIQSQATAAAQASAITASAPLSFSSAREWSYPRHLS